MASLGKKQPDIQNHLGAPRCGVLAGDAFRMPLISTDLKNETLALSHLHASIIFFLSSTLPIPQGRVVLEEQILRNSDPLHMTDPQQSHRH